MILNNTSIGIGTWALGAGYWGQQNHSDSLKMIHAALREGYTLYDTAPVYGKGKSEQLLGQQLSKHRENIKISTKCFIKPVASVKKSIEQSLKRLNCDYIDNFFIHWPSTKDDSRPIIELLENYRSLGIIKNIGLSNFNQTELVVAQQAGTIDVVQNGFNFFWREDIEYLTYCKKNQIVTQIYSPLAQGLLTGKFTKENPYIKKDLRYKMSLFSPQNIEIVYQYIDKLKLFTDKSTELSTLILEWTLSQNYIDTIIVGCRNRYQIEELTKLKDFKISPKKIEELDQLSIEASFQISCEKNIFNHSY
ncbi:MAG: aldo/keto reductase [Spirochaetaceae bacterium]